MAALGVDLELVGMVFRDSEGLVICEGLRGEAGIPGGVAVEGDHIAVEEEAEGVHGGEFGGVGLGGGGWGFCGSAGSVDGEGGGFGKVSEEAVHECVVICEEGLGERVAAGLFHEVVEDPPAHVSVPGGLDVAGHLADAGAVHPGGCHTIGLVDMAHEAVADGEVDLGVGGLDGMLVALSIESVELSLIVFEVAVFVAEADLPVVFCGVTGGNE